ncbi:hypothetical protein SmJEL517_g02641 [Synchytrium microbalum]|uniref:Uncharacterized protein n=1 Tax=Synchytrium microbalum TaxID=1806994 RepID=A0A507C542_9FUNG|nr:uncharacterized protein SmJEL517_g02641 [Synchytrium microbalum]TPX34802.1 hypothetical protein SmJEL517_g02641 [Synchytrium microbalum]
MTTDEHMQPNEKSQVQVAEEAHNKQQKQEQCEASSLPQEVVLLLTASLPKFGLSLTATDQFLDEKDTSNDSSTSTKQFFEQLQKLGRQLGYLESSSSGFRGLVGSGNGGVKRKRRDGESVLQHYDMEKPAMVSRIESFIQAKRSKIDSSNQAEFTRVDQADSCARSDTVELNRSVQMKIAVAHNKDDPLARSWRHTTDASSSGNTKPTPNNAATVPKTHLVSERLSNIESYLDVPYQPAPKRASNNTNNSISNGGTSTTGANGKNEAQVIKEVLSRIKIVEDRIVTLEREYPAWSTNNLNQNARNGNPQISNNNTLLGNRDGGNSLSSGVAMSMGARGLGSFAIAAVNGKSTDKPSQQQTATNVQQQQPKPISATQSTPPSQTRTLVTSVSNVLPQASAVDSDEEDSDEGDLSAIELKIKALKESLLARKL